ncbi:hypothetical protein O1C60_003796 [Vibrio cholerae]|nr:hypothetical protein [Vibrio cholerae]EKF9648613.1 hypothetical protein [Vibrio cholerae]EKF9652387.1 hypothetical protein [Vibrio cholerae]
MSNWFENNPTKSVLIHTVLVATATWAAFTFVFDENRVKLHEAKVARAEAETKEVNARNSVLVTRLDYLTKENEKLNRWLEQEPKSIPYYEKQLTVLSEKIESLEGALQLAQERESGSNTEKGDRWVDELLKRYNEVQLKPVQQSIYDPLTGVVVGADRVTIDGKTDIKITFPDGKKIEQKSAAPGETWNFQNNGKEYRLILDSADWSTQRFGTRIIELNRSEGK